MSPEFLDTCRKHGVLPTPLILMVRVANQTVTLFENRDPHSGSAPFTPMKTYSCSTSRFGIGQCMDSQCTPLGLHRIAEKIGGGEPEGTVFRGRQSVGHTSQPEFADAKITTRILWLDGLEPGHNRGDQVDTHARYIYIHGTADQSSIGTPASCGCIHLADDDLIPLFDQLPSGSLVWITA